MRRSVRNGVSHPALFAADMQLGQGAHGASATANYPITGPGSITYDRQELPFDFDGTQTIKITTGDNTNTNLDIPISPAINMSETDCISIMIYVPESTSLFNLIFYLSAQGGNFTKFFVSGTIQGTAVPAGWSTMTLNRSQFTTSNGALWSQIDRFRVRLTSATGGGTRTLNLARVALGERHTPVYCLTFDDGWLSAHSIVAPMLEAAGLRGTFYITKQLIGISGNYMVASQVKDLYDRGHMIGNHYSTHDYNLNTRPADEVTAGWEETANWLVQIGCPKHVNHACYVGSGGFLIPTAQTYNATKKAGMISAVTVQGGEPYLASHRRDRMYIPRNLAGQGISDTAIKSQIDETLKKGGLRMMFAHNIAATEVQNADWATSKLQSVVDYLVRLQRQGLITHMTVAEALDAIDGGRRAA